MSLDIMSRQKSGNWKPKSVFLLPSTFKDGVRFPGTAEQKGLHSRGYGSCSVEGGVDRSWSREELERWVCTKYPIHRDELESRGVAFARLERGSKLIKVHTFEAGETVATLELRHGCGILVVLISSNVSRQRPPPPPLPLPQQQQQQEQSPQKVTPATTSPSDTIKLDLLHLRQLEGIKVAHLNCQSIRNKVTQLRQMLCKTDIDVLTISETFLRPSDKSDRIDLPGYTIVARQDRGYESEGGMGRGGVLTYVKDHLMPQVQRQDDGGEILDKDCLEAVRVDIRLESEAQTETKSGEKSPGCRRRRLLRVINVYVRPATRKQIAHLRKLKDILSEVKANDRCQTTIAKTRRGNSDTCLCQVSYVILGDFNCDMLMTSKNMYSPMEEKLQTVRALQNDLKLKQLITEPTRVCCRKENRKKTYKETSSLLDLIFVDEDADISSSGVIRLEISDHFMVYCSWNAPRTEPASSPVSSSSAPLLKGTSKKCGAVIPKKTSSHSRLKGSKQRNRSKSREREH